MQLYIQKNAFELIYIAFAHLILISEYLILFHEVTK